MPRKQSRAPTTDTCTPTEVIPFDNAVSEGKEIIAQIEVAERGQLRLGELADKLEPKYKDRTLAKFAAEIGIQKCTLERYRTTYRAWAGKLAPGPNLVSYSVLRELAKHPEREQIVRANPNISKREAHKLMRKQEYTAKVKHEQEQEDDGVKQDRKWFRDLATIANEAMRAAGVVHDCTPEQLKNLLRVIDPSLLMHVRAGGNALRKLADRLEQLLEEQDGAEQADCETLLSAARVQTEAIAHAVA
jgi:hypothetical protein